MSGVTYLGTCDGNTLRDLADQVDAGEVTHAAVTYRTSDGDLRYRLIGVDDLTYLVGMLGRVGTHLHCVDTFEIPDSDS